MTRVGGEPFPLKSTQPYNRVFHLKSSISITRWSSASDRKFGFGHFDHSKSNLEGSASMCRCFFCRIEEPPRSVHQRWARISSRQSDGTDRARNALFASRRFLAGSRILIISSGYRFFGEPAIVQLRVARHENSEVCTPVQNHSPRPFPSCMATNRSSFDLFLLGSARRDSGCNGMA